MTYQLLVQQLAEVAEEPWSVEDWRVVGGMAAMAAGKSIAL